MMFTLDVYFIDLCHLFIGLFASTIHAYDAYSTFCLMRKMPPRAFAAPAQALVSCREREYGVTAALRRFTRRFICRHER